MPIYTNLIEDEDFGVSIFYLYNSNAKPGLSGLNLTDIKQSNTGLNLVGCSYDIENPDECRTVTYTNTEYIDPGYDAVGQNYYVEITGSVDTSREGIYFVTYTMFDQYRVLIDQKVRTVVVEDSEHVFTYTGSKQTFEISEPGRYLIQLWGASGGGKDSMSGKGGYIEGYFNFNYGDILSFFVGGKGTLSTKGVI